MVVKVEEMGEEEEEEEKEEVGEMVAALLAMGNNIPSACEDLLCSTKYHLIPHQDFCNNYGYQDP